VQRSAVPWSQGEGPLNIKVQELTVEALATGRKDHVRHAAMLDPHTAAELSLDEIAALVDDLLAAHEGWLPPLR
jgi:alpha-galactosidase